VSLHKLSHIIHKGPVPDGMDVCHTCDNRRCWNPHHLWLGTRKQNMEDCTRKGRHGNLLKTHCVNGHEFTPDNIDWRLKPSGVMGRHCKACQRERQRRDRLERPELVRARQIRARAKRKARSAA
jgi:hypothetical protein